MIQVLERAAKVMDTVGKNGGVTFTDVQRATGLHKATLSHILKTLGQLGYVRKTGTGTYEVGPTILSLAGPRLRRSSLAAVAEHAARALAEEIQESVTVGVLRDLERYNIAKAEYNQSVTVNAQLQQRPSPYDTTTGRVLLSGLTDGELKTLWNKKGAPGKSWAAVGTLKDLRQEVASIRTAGLAEAVTGGGEVHTFAVPIMGPDGKVWAAIGFGAPAYRMDQGKQDQKLEALRQAAKRMEHMLALEWGEARQEIKA